MSDCGLTPESNVGSHALCFACGGSPDGGLHLDFVDTEQGRVAAWFDCPPRFQGYPERLHGGIIATLLDAAMTHWLFHHGITAYTVSLQVRYRRGVATSAPALVEGWSVKERGRLYRMEATVSQHGKVCARAAATFLEELIPGVPLNS